MPTVASLVQIKHACIITRKRFGHREPDALFISLIYPTLVVCPCPKNLRLPSLSFLIYKVVNQML